MPSRSSQRGLTLIELMVTIAVLAILLALAVPAFSDFFEKARLRGAADDLESFVNAQRLNAVRSDRDINLTLRGAGSNWCVGARAAADPALGAQVPPATACDCIDDATECTVGGQQAVLSSAASGSSTTIDAADIAVVIDSQRGTLTNFANAGNVVLTSSSGRFQLRVDVQPLGQARTCVTAASEPMSGYSPC